MRQLIRNERGFTLLGVLMVLVIFSVLGFSILAVASSSVKLSDNERDDQAVYYIAEGGANKVLSEIEKKVNNLSEITNNEAVFYYEFDKYVDELKNEIYFTDSQGAAEVKISKINFQEYRITSIGRIGKNLRNVEGTFTIKYEEGEKGLSFPEGLGVYSKNKLELNGGTIDGNLITNSKECGNILIDGNPTINGIVIAPTDSCFEAIQGPDWWIRDKMPVIQRQNINFEFPLPVFPEFPKFETMPDEKIGNHKVLENGNLNITNYLVADYKLKLNKNYEFNNITINSNRKLTFDIGSKDISIVVNRIEGENGANGNIYIEGSGSLTIYVRDNIQLKGAHFNPYGIGNLFIYIGPSSDPNNPKTFNKSDHGIINASVYAADADIELSGSVNYTGHIVTGGSNVKIPGGTQATSEGTVVYAPNAKVELLGSGKLTGAVIAEKFKISGGASVDSKDRSFDDIPFFPDIDGDKSNVIIEFSPLLEK